MKHLNYQPGIFCLNHGWKFSENNITVLPTEKSHTEVYSYAKAGAARGPACTSFDDSEWESVSLPHDWVTKKDFSSDACPNQGYKERGMGWYRLKFNLEPEDASKQILLECEGMSCDAQIYCNGQLLKRNFSGYNSFSVDMTDMAHFGIIPNVLAVYIDASAWEGWWYEGAGIYRHIWMVKKAPIHIAFNGCFVKPIKLDDNRWQVEIETTIENSFEYNKEYTIETEIKDAAGEIVVTAKTNGLVKGFGRNADTQSLFVLQPKLWDTASPNLYYAKVKITSDDQESDYLITEFGFRTIRIDAESGFWINGENVKLKGFCNHQDHAGVGAAVPYAIKEYRIKLLKELGANAYRCAHNTDPEILEICDHFGMMVMEENRTYSSAEDNIERVREMIANSRNHPSVIMYSVFNEEPLQGTGKGRRMAGRLQAAVKSMDDTRPVLGAFNGGYMEEAGAATILDVTGINYNPARYDEFHAKFPNTPLVGSETASAFMVRGEYNTDSEAHTIASYDDDCALWGNTVRDAWRWVNERPFVAGTFVWTGFDYRGEPTPYEWPSVATFFGTYDSCGFEKDACYLYKAFWLNKPVLHLLPHWNLKVEEGTTVKVMVFTNCDEVELYLNDKILERKTCDPYDQVSFQVPYEKGTLKAVGYKDSKEVITEEIKTVKEAKDLYIECSKDTLTNDGLDSVAINVYAIDCDGNRIPNADTMIHFEVKGGAEIIGIGNGNPNSHEPDVASYRSLYNGYAQAILRNSGDEDVIVKVSGGELTSAVVTIPTICTEHIPYLKTVKEQIIDGWKLYYKLFEEMPNPNPVVDNNDMNSFEPVSFEGKAQPHFENQYLKYGLYRVVTDLGKEVSGRNLFFGDVKGKAWIYLDGELIAERRENAEMYVSIDVPDSISGQHVITAIIQNMDQDWSQAGICNPVTLRR